MSQPNRNKFQRLIATLMKYKRTSSYVIILTCSMHGYIIGHTAFCSMLVICYMKFTATSQFYTNIISYTHAYNFMPAGNSQLTLYVDIYIRSYSYLSIKH